MAFRGGGIPLIEITSIQNAQVKQWKKLKTAKGRRQQSLYLVEGPHLLDEALKTGQKIEWIMTSQAEEVFSNFAQKYDEEVLNSYRWVHISEEIRKELSATVTDQNVFAVIEKSISQDFTVDAKSRFLVLDGIQDPGNMGTLLRSAVAFGFHQVFLSPDCVDIYNDKVLRSGQGAHYYLQFSTGDLETFYAKLKEEGVVVYTTALTKDSISSDQASYRSPLALVLGNEGKGVSKVSQTASDKNILIPMSTSIDSLNVGVAGSILLYQASLVK
ncbi:RNA methyltransferase [Atopobacter sp. AH10]|nr:RNA methyltransferase [Atopobacter sp. AH10]